jgi:hypothetical protein
MQLTATHRKRRQQNQRFHQARWLLLKQTAFTATTKIETLNPTYTFTY